MRIAHIYGSVNKMHGATKWLMSFSSKLQDQGHVSTVYCVTFSIPIPSWFTAELKPTFSKMVISEKLPKIKKLVFTLFQMSGTALMPLRLKKPDCIVYHAELSIAAILLGRIFHPNAKHIYYCYQPPRELYDLVEGTKKRYGTIYYFLAPFFEIYKTVDRYLVRKSDLILVWSPEVETYARSIYGNIKISHIPPGVDYDSIENAPDIENRVKQLRDDLGLSDEKVLLSICALTWKKNLDRFIDLVAELDKYGIPIHGIIIGTGVEQERLEKYAVDLGISGKVYFAGTVTEEDLPVYIHLADILLYLESGGAWTMASVEAGAARKPVIVGAGGSMKTLVKNGETGFIVDTDKNRSSLLTQTLSILLNRDIAFQMGQNNYIYSKRFSIESCIGSFINIMS